MIILKSVGDRIRALRESKGWTQDRLASELHVSRQAVSKWEVGASLPDVDCLVHLAECFLTTVDEILTGENRNDDTHDDRRSDSRESSETKPGSETGSIDLDSVIGLAPMISGDALDAMLESIPAHRFEFRHVQTLGPFAGGRVLSQIVRNMAAGKIGDDEIESLRAFISDEAISEYKTRSSY